VTATTSAATPVRTDTSTIVVTECDHDAFAQEQDVADAAGVTFRVEQANDRAALERACADADGILVQYATIDGPLMDALPHLRVVGRYGVGVDSVDVQAATERGIAVCNVPDYGTEAVSDHAIGLALAVARGIPLLDRGVRAGRVDLARVRPLHQIAGRRFGVVGLGRIGRATARKAAGLGYDVVGFDVLATPGTDYRGVRAVTLEELCATVDVVSVHVPLHEGTRGMIGTDQLALMRPTTVVVNTARGGVVDTEALVAALDRDAIGGAAIDTHDAEPLPTDHPLTRFDNVVLTPHLAWYTEESYRELKRRTAQNVVDVLAGSPPREVVNPEAWGRGRTADLAARTIGA
jgi:D-3-phosphoglycerate dehydrogenase / 2-oxoglutarate reductase